MMHYQDYQEHDVRPVDAAIPTAIDERTGNTDRFMAAMFPVMACEKVFFSHCSVSPLPKTAADAMRRLIESMSFGGGLDRGERGERERALRRHAARLIGATPDEIALTSNTVQGIQIVANGIRWRPGDNIVSADIEFPANVYPWQNLSQRGVELRLIQSRNGRVTVDDVAAAIDSRTRLVSLSHVQFLNGFRLDAEGIGALCRERGIYFMLDAIQSLGAIQLDVRRVPVDFIAAGGHKWMLGPLGSGFMYCRQEVIEDLDISTVGHRSMVQGTSYLPHRFDPHPTAARFEGGAANTYGIYGLEASLRLLLTIGMHNVERSVLLHHDHLVEGLARRGYQINPIYKEAHERSGIVAFAHPRIPGAEIVRQLSEEDILVTQNLGWVRAAPHFYNTRDEIDRFLDALP